MGYIPSISWIWYPPPGPGMGYPPVSWMGYPISWWWYPCSWDGVPPTPSAGWHTPHQLDWVPPTGHGMGYPSPISWMAYLLSAGWGTMTWPWDGVPPSPHWLDGVPFPLTAKLQTFLPKTGVLDGNCIITKFLSKLCQIFDKNLIETPVLGRNV